MKLERIVLCVAVLSCPAPALADPIFFDDFDGDALLPHWGLPHPLEWSYNVSNGMLNVTGLFNPSVPDVPGNIATMGTFFTAQTDFRVDVWMGLAAVQFPQRLAMTVGGIFGGNPRVATFGYVFDGSVTVPSIFAGANNQALFMPAPEPGIHQFTFSRTGTLFSFLLDGIPFWTVADTFRPQAAALSIEFVAPYPGPQSAFSIDRVVIVPSPGSLALLITTSLAGAWRGERRGISPGHVPHSKK